MAIKSKSIIKVSVAALDVYLLIIKIILLNQCQIR